LEGHRECSRKEGVSLGSKHQRKRKDFVKGEMNTGKAGKESLKD
jgi:hypothetical protein